MLLFDELEEKYNSSKKETTEDFKHLSMELYNIMRTRFLDKNNLTAHDLSVSAKQINNSWNLFTKEHPEFKQDGFKEHLKTVLSEEQFNLLFN